MGNFVLCFRGCLAPWYPFYPSYSLMFIFTFVWNNRDFRRWRLLTPCTKTRAAGDLKSSCVLALYSARIPPNSQQTRGRVHLFSEISMVNEVHPSSGPRFLLHNLHYQSRIDDVYCGNRSASSILSMMVIPRWLSVSYLSCDPL